jgi:predicted O-methyltransferase YrrM
MGVVSVLKNILKPGYLGVIAKKIVYRFENSGSSRNEYLKWYESNSTTIESFSGTLDAALFEEATKYDKELNERATQILSALPVKLGGGGFSTLIYYMVRKMKPALVVETGVAAGFSSQAILKALSVNGSGELYSSDFPYFRIDNPEKYVGIIVEPELKKNWHLYTAGDEVNLPAIVAQLKGKRIDLLHYDSDKSYTGRVRALKTLRDHFHSDTWLLFDDINDNSHFKDFVENEKHTYRIFKHKRKYIGVICLNKDLLDKTFSRLDKNQ